MGLESEQFRRVINSGTFTIPLTDDLISEENETFTITLSRPNNAVIATNDMMISKTATIEDNEPPILKITTTDFTVDENVGATGFQLAFELSNPTDQEVSFQFDVTDGTAEEGVDYTRPVLAARMIRIPIGNTTRTITIPILEDSLNEGNETFTFSLLSSSVSGAVLEDNATEYSQTITIEDDEDPTLSITPTTFEVFEDIGSLVVEFKLSGPTDSDVTFKYDLNEGDATKEADYTEAVEAERNLTIRRGDLTTTISIPITNDAIVEPDGETFTLMLSNLSNAVFARGSTLSQPIKIFDVTNITLAMTTTDFNVLENIGGNGFEVNVELSEVANLDVTFDYNLTNGTAFKPYDYVEPTNRRVVIPEGDTTDSFFISIVDDLNITGSLTFTLELSNIVGARFANSGSTISETIRILDNETPLIGITTDNLSVAESIGAGGLVLNFELLEASNADIDINYATTDITPSSDNTATQGVDYTNTSGKITIDAGDRTGSFTIPITDDSDGEESESFTINLTTPGAAEFRSNGQSSLNLTATILDNETPTLSIEDGPLVSESDGHAVFTISTSVSPVTNDFRVNYIPTSDAFVQNSGSRRQSDPLNFTDPDGDGIFTAPLRVQLAADMDPELNGFIVVELTTDTAGAESYYVSSDNTASVFVADDDAAIPVLSLGNISTPIVESAGSVEFTIYASEYPGRELTVYYTPAEVGQGDFLTNRVARTISSSVTFPNQPGRVESTISVDLDDDSLGEDSGMIRVTLANDSAPSPTYTVIVSNARRSIVSILDDDAPVISIGDAATTFVTEGTDTEIRFPLTALVSPNDMIDIYYTLEETTYDDGDFIADSETGFKNKEIDFSSDSTSSHLVIPIVAADDVTESSSRVTVTLEAQPGNLSAASYNVPTQNSPVSINIVDPNYAAISEISIADASGLETDTGTTGTVEFTVNLDSVVSGSQAVTVNYQVYSLPENTATAGDNTPTGDYVTQNGILTFNTGENEQTITVVTNGDNEPEIDETFSVILSHASSNATIADHWAIGTIKSNEPLAIGITDASIEEGDTGTKQLEFTVNLSSGAFNEISVRYRTVDGTATAGADYTAPTEPSNRLRFAVGENVKKFSIPIIGDINYERDETFTVELYDNSTGTTLLATSVIGTIEENDPEVPEVSIGSFSSSIDEGHTARFYINVLPNSANAIPIRVEFSDNNRGFLQSSQTGTRTIMVNSFILLDEPTVLNLNPAEDGAITATILEDNTTPPRYILAETNSVSTVSVQDQFVFPYVELDEAIVTTGVTRGHNFEITARLSEALTSDIQVEYAIENEGNKAPSVLSTIGFITIPANQLTGSKLIEVNQNHTTSVPADATYQVTINSIAPSVYIVLPERDNITIPVFENSAPTAERPLVSITTSITEEVVQSSTIDYTVSAFPAPASRLPVKVFVSSTGGNVIDRGDLGERTIVLTNANPSSRFEITTNSGPHDSAYGTVKARVIQGAGYVLPITETDFGSRTIAAGALNKTDSATIVVEEQISVSISTAADEYNEGASFQARLVPLTTPNFVTPVNIRVTETGSFLQSRTLNLESVDLQTTTYTEFPIDLNSINNEYESNSVVTIEVIDGLGYQRGSVFSKEVTILEQDLPTVSFVALSPTIRKGENARFQVTSNFTSTSPITLALSFRTDPMDLIPNLSSAELTIPAGSRESNIHSIIVPRDADTDYDLLSTITASARYYSEILQEYQVIQQTVDVIDDDIPTGISILKSMDSIVDGETAEFIIMADSTASTDRNISITVTEKNRNNAVVDDNSKIIDTNAVNYPYETITIPRNSLFTRLQIATVRQFESFPSVSISVTLDSSNTGLATTNTSASIAIQDSLELSKPEVSISAISESVVEGYPARFTITLDPATKLVSFVENGTIKTEQVPNTAMVALRISEVNNALGSGVQQNQLFRVEGSGTFEVPTRVPNDATDSASSITVALLDRFNGYRTDYRVAYIPNDSATVSVTDEGPEITLSTNNQSVNEGDTMHFQVSLDPAVKVAYQYRVSETGNFVESGSLGVFTKSANDPNYNQISVFTKVANSVFEPNRIVTVELLPDTAVKFSSTPLNNNFNIERTISNYTLGAAKSVNVTVLDDSSPSGGISIIALDDLIEPGGVAEFEVRSDTAITGSAKSINVAMTSTTSSLIASANASQQVTIPVGANSKRFSIQIENPLGFVSAATVTATVQAGGANYSLASSDTSATVSVITTQIPIANIEVNQTSISEGQSIQVDFTLSHSNSNHQIPADGVEVEFSVAQTGPNFLNFRGINGTGTQSVEFTRLGTITYVIGTQAVPDQASGSITIELSNDSGSPGQYVLDPNAANTHTISVNNVATKPELSLSRMGSGSIVEGGIWRLKVAVSPPAPYPFSFWLAGTQTGDFFLPGYHGIYDYAADIPIGATEAFIYGTTENDLIDEEDGSITLAVMSTELYTIDPDFGAITINVTDDDEGPTVSFDSDSVVSPESTGNMRFDVRLSSESEKPVTINYVLDEGTATQPEDYDTSVNQLVIQPGQKSRPIYVEIKNSAGVSEENESFTLKITSVENGQIAGGASELVATGTITDNDNASAKPVITINNPEISENRQQLIFRVTMSKTLTGETVELTYDTSDGTATAGSDYTAVTADPTNPNLVFAAGEQTKDIIIALPSDDIDEYDETFNVVLTRPTTTTNVEFPGGASVSTLTGVGTILDDDTEPVLTMDITNSADENNGTMSFEVKVMKIVTRGENLSLEETTSAKDITVSYQTVNHTAVLNSDFNIPAGPLTIPAGQSSGTIDVTLIHLDAKEDDEKFTLVLSNPINALFEGVRENKVVRYQYLTSEATIEDVDGPLSTLSFKTTDFNANEEGGDFAVTVELDTPAVQEVTFTVEAAPVSAEKGSGKDFNDPTQTTGTIAIGNDEATILIPILSDTAEEGNETFTLTLSNILGATFVGGGTTLTQEITIIDDDVPELTIADATGIEGDDSSNGSVAFMPTLDRVAVQPVVIAYSIAPSGFFPADADDYTSASASGMITIPIGATTPNSPTSISIETVADGDSEPNETFTLTFSATNATVVDNTAIGTIISDDPQVIAITDVTVDEDDGTATLNVAISPAPTNPVEVTYVVSTNSAETPADYTETTSTPIEFTSSNDSEEITFNIVDDSIAENSETITVTLSNTDDINYYQSKNTGTVTITDDDPLPTINLVALPDDITEGTNSANNTTQNVTVNLGVDGTGNAIIAGRDIRATYTLAGIEANVSQDIKLAATAPGRVSDSTGTLIIQKGSSSATIPLEIIADNYDEDNERFTLNFTVTEFATASSEQFTGTIVDDDSSVASISTTHNAPEGSGDNRTRGADSLDVVLSVPSTKTVKVDYAFTDVTAINGTDYSGVNNTLTFNPDPTTGITATSMPVPFSITQDS